MEMSRYSIKPNAGKGLIGFITNFNVAGEFDPAWLDSNPLAGFFLWDIIECQRPSMVGFKPRFFGC